MFCEFDKYATQSYCAIHKTSEDLNLGDITKVNEKEIVDFNFMCGGSPCQDFSVAGKQEGAKWTCKECEHEYNPLEAHYDKRDRCPKCNSTEIEKTRSSLLVEWLRILREKKPNFAMYENVKNIIGKQFKPTFEMFVQELNEYGYNTYFQVLNAKNYGVPQNRERVYLIIIKKELDNGKFEFPKAFDSGIRLKDILDEEVDEKYYLSDKQIKKIQLSSFIQEKRRIQKADVCECLLARDYKDPKCVQVATLNTMQGGNRQPKILQKPRGFNKDGIHDECTTISSRSWECNNFVLNESKGCIIKEFDIPKEVINDNERQRRVYNPQGISPTVLSRSDSTKIVEKQDCDDQQYVDNISDNYKFLKSKCQEILDKNGSLPNIFNPYNQQEIKDIAPTQTTSCDRSCSSATVLFKQPDFRIRKLTPKECFRLMGFSDEYFDLAQQSGVSNSQLYKQAGNSIVTDVLFYILLELHRVMPYLFEDIQIGSFFSGIGAFEVAMDRLYDYINNGEDKNFTQPQE